MTPSDGVERESAEDVKARQDAEKIAANDERQLRLGHVEEEEKKPKSKPKSKPKEESKESEA